MILYRGIYHKTDKEIIQDSIREYNSLNSDEEKVKKLLTDWSAAATTFCVVVESLKSDDLKVKMIEKYINRYSLKTPGLYQHLPHHREYLNRMYLSIQDPKKRREVEYVYNPYKPREKTATELENEVERNEEER